MSPTTYRRNSQCQSKNHYYFTYTAVEIYIQYIKLEDPYLKTEKTVRPLFGKVGLGGGGGIIRPITPGNSSLSGHWDLRRERDEI